MESTQQGSSTTRHEEKPSKVRKIVVLVVHGIGEQRRFGTVEEIALNLVKALRKDSNRHAHLEVLEGDQAQRHGTEPFWQNAPARVSWSVADGRVEATFREVFWADLDYPITLWRWGRLIKWALTMPGVRIFSLGDGIPGSQEQDPAAHGLLSPHQLSFRSRLWVRTQLWLICSPLFITLLFANVVQIVLRRVFSFDLKLDRILYDYLGDVLLYQDWLIRKDIAEGYGEKSRVAIRGRMVRALVQAAADCSGETPIFHGYYIFAHSLGTVVAFNALMEPAHILPNHLTQEDWQRLPGGFKKSLRAASPATQMPQRPTWLGPKDAIDRGALLEKLQGFLSVGSPLDKFAALWPAVVPLSEKGLNPSAVRWLNVCDVQDLVGARIDLFNQPVNAGGTAFDLKQIGFQLENAEWVGVRTIFSAHTSYWKAAVNRIRLIDRLIPWLEDGNAPFQPPPNLWKVKLGRVVFVVLTVLSLVGLLLLDTAIVRFLPMTAKPLGLEAWVEPYTKRVTELGFWQLYKYVVLICASAVLIFSLIRRSYERFRWGRQYLKDYKARPGESKT